MHPRAPIGIAFALTAFGAAGCSPGKPLALTLAQQKDSISLEVTNQTSETLPYTDEILTLAKRREGDFYVLVQDSGPAIRLCGVVDTPIPKARQLAPGSGTTFQIPLPSQLYCLKSGQPYRLTIQYRAQLDNLEPGAILFASNTVGFIAQDPVNAGATENRE